jgi:aryl-alcohol dehydrogenase
MPLAPSAWIEHAVGAIGMLAGRLGGLTMRATAAIFEKLHTPFTVADVEVDEPGPGEVLVRIVASGVCHTDALARDGDMPFPAPGVLGHEGAGIVAAVGSGVSGVAVGDKVVIGWPWCGSCRNCLEGQPRYCLSLGPLVASGGRADGSTALRRLDGSPLHSHFFGQSSFATYSLCAANALVPVPSDVPAEILGPLACGISTGAGAVLNALRPPVGSSVVVYGAGAVGLSAVMAARLTGATTIIAVDRLASRLSLARELGATETIDVSVAGTDPVAATHEICGGPADFSLDCAGAVPVLQQAAASVGMRGTVALIGGAPAGASFSLEHQPTLWGKRVVGILGGEGRSASLIGSLITLNRQGRFPYDRLITPFPLERVNEALEASHAGEVIKPVLRMPA